MMIPRKAVIRIVLATTLILSVPSVAMQFTDEVAWSLADFVVMGALLLGTGFTFELVARQGSHIAYRVAVGIALAAALILVWVNLAVGIFGSEENPANLLYAGVLGVGLIGAAIARLKPRGMARTLFATALAQGLVPVIALIVWKPPIAPGVLGVTALNTSFVLMFVGSALCFRRAAREWEGPGAEPAA